MVVAMQFFSLTTWAAESKELETARQLMKTMQYGEVMANTMEAGIHDYFAAKSGVMIGKLLAENEQLSEATKPEDIERQLNQRLKLLDIATAKLPEMTHTLLHNPQLIRDLDEFAANLYASHFSLDELRQLTALYASPVGKKLLQLTHTEQAAFIPLFQKWMPRWDVEMQSQLRALRDQAPE